MADLGSKMAARSGSRMFVECNSCISLLVVCGRVYAFLAACLLGTLGNPYSPLNLGQLFNIKTVS
mgnify:CR=1 FL=1